MSESERSVIIYLLDAIRANPDHLSRYLSIIDKKDASPAFQETINMIRNSENVVFLAADLREKMR